MDALQKEFFSIEVAPGLALERVCKRDAPRALAFVLELYGLKFLVENGRYFEENKLFPRSRVNLSNEALERLAGALESMKPALESYIKERECCNSAVVYYYSGLLKFLRAYGKVGAPELALPLLKYFMRPVALYLSGKRYYEVLVYRAVVLDNTLRELV